MPKIRLMYIAGFNLDKHSGRNKATLEKVNALKNLVRQQYTHLYPGGVKLLHPGSSSVLLVSYLKAFFFDIYLLVRLFFIHRKSIVIQRTTFLPLTNFYLKIRGVKIIYELHTDLNDEIKFYNKGWLEKTLLRAYAIFEKVNICLSSALIYNHPVLMEKISAEMHCARKKMVKGKAIYSYNGADTDLFFPMGKYVCQNELNLKADLRYYLFIGSLSKWRGVDLLIDVFNRYMEADDVLLIVGNADHDYGKQLKKIADKNANIRFYNEVPPAEVVKWINASDVCLVPVKPVLKSPGNPLKLYDYVACGKPIVGQENVIGCADEVINFGLGVVTDFYDAERAAEDLKKFYENHDATAYLHNNRTMAKEYLNWEKRMSEWLKLASKL